MVFYRPCIVFAQEKNSEFIHKFYATNSQEKLRLLAELDYSRIQDVYPFVKDTLDVLKKEVYKDSESNKNQLKFLIEKFEAKKELSEKHPDKAIYLLENALRHSVTDADDSLSCLSLMKEVFISTKNVSRAFEIHHLLENNWHKKSETADINFGARKSHLFHLLGMNKEAVLELRKEFNSRPNKTDTLSIINFHNDIGVFYNQENQADSAEANLLRAKKYLSLHNSPKEKESFFNFYNGLVDGNLALSYFNQGKIREAIPLLKNDIYYSNQTKNYLSAFNANHLLLKSYIQLKNTELATLYVDSIETLLDTHLKDLNLKAKFLKTLADYYMLMTNYKMASITFENYYHLNDSLLKSEAELTMLNQGLAYNINQREMAYQEQDKRMKEAQLEEAREKNFRVSVLAGLLILLIIIFFLSINNRRFKMREKQLSLKNEQIQNQNTQIEQTLKEKEALIKEIHHRVKNNLQIITSMLNLQVGRIDDEKTEQIFFEARQRINAIALTHQMLYQRSTISEVNLKEYVEGLVRQIEATLSATKIKIITHLNTGDETLTIDGAVPLGLIINELLTNSYKHAFPVNKEGIITVSLLSKEHSLLIKVSDNGIGLPEDFKASENRSLGMELILILIEQLDSKLIVENDNGSTFMFEINKHSSIERS